MPKLVDIVESKGYQRIINELIKDFKTQNPRHRDYPDEDENIRKFLKAKLYNIYGKEGCAPPPGTNYKEYLRKKLKEETPALLTVRTRGTYFLPSDKCGGAKRRSKRKRGRKSQNKQYSKKKSLSKAHKQLRLRR